ncbi:MAG: hypothetical protein ACMXYD_02375 [Candidatus Woesearchaeota archaeon]
MVNDEYIEDYEGELDLEDAGYLEDYEEEDSFEQEYDKLFDEGSESASLEYERDPVTGRKAKKPRLSVLNQSNVSTQELDELFLEN